MSQKLSERLLENIEDNKEFIGEVSLNLMSGGDSVSWNVAKFSRFLGGLNDSPSIQPNFARYLLRELKKNLGDEIQVEDKDGNYVELDTLRVHNSLEILQGMDAKPFGYLNGEETEQGGLVRFSTYFIHALMGYNKDDCSHGDFFGDSTVGHWFTNCIYCGHETHF